MLGPCIAHARGLSVEISKYMIRTAGRKVKVWRSAIEYAFPEESSACSDGR